MRLPLPHLLSYGKKDTLIRKYVNFLIIVIIYICIYIVN